MKKVYGGMPVLIRASLRALMGGNLRKHDQRQTLVQRCACCSQQERLINEQAKQRLLNPDAVGSCTKEREIYWERVKIKRLLVLLNLPSCG